MTTSGSHCHRVANHEPKADQCVTFTYGYQIKNFKIGDSRTLERICNGVDTKLPDDSRTISAGQYSLDNIPGQYPRTIPSGQFHFNVGGEL